MESRGCILILFLMAIITPEVLLMRGGCPQPSKVLICTPTCITDRDCRNGWLCCDNICHTKSCTNLRNDGNDGYKNTVYTATGTYCGGVKCNSYERCETDRNSRRERCVPQ
ncbi:waprin-Phi2-like [Ctenocephalides felis]|uniref:waprin-Phi2-like n=1 Tax=Ctenocephalides felis TaxID=7515 RepID=UPI000E6E53C0|nr:waprin-Phi2-like [Ctenocephalides felis]